MPPLCKGRCQTDEGRLTERLLLSREITLGTTTPQSGSTPASSPLRTETAFQAVPVLRMAYSLQTAHCAVCRETLMLQVRCAHPTGVFAPKRLFKPFRCYGRLIFRKEYTVLFAPKRSTSRFAALTLRVTSHRNDPSSRSGVPHGLFSFRTDPPSVRRCSARLIRQAETLELQPRSRPPSKRTALSVGKHSCFRFAARTLRIQGSQTARPYASPV